MSDKCTHEKAKITVDGSEGPERVCPLCDDVEFQTLDEGSV